MLQVKVRVCICCLKSLLSELLFRYGYTILCWILKCKRALESLDCLVRPKQIFNLVLALCFPHSCAFCSLGLVWFFLLNPKYLIIEKKLFKESHKTCSCNGRQCWTEPLCVSVARGTGLLQLKSLWTLWSYILFTSNCLMGHHTPPELCLGQSSWACLLVFIYLNLVWPETDLEKGFGNMFQRLSCSRAVLIVYLFNLNWNTNADAKHTLRFDTTGKIDHYRRLD